MKKELTKKDIEQLLDEEANSINALQYSPSDKRLEKILIHIQREILLLRKLLEGNNET